MTKYPQYNPVLFKWKNHQTHHTVEIQRINHVAPAVKLIKLFYHHKQ